MTKNYIDSLPNLPNDFSIKITVKFPWTNRRVYIYVPSAWKVRDLLQSIKEYCPRTSDQVFENARIVPLSDNLNEQHILLFNMIGNLGAGRPFISKLKETFQDQSSSSNDHSYTELLLENINNKSFFHLLNLNNTTRIHIQPPWYVSKPIECYVPDDWKVKHVHSMMLESHAYFDTTILNNGKWCYDAIQNDTLQDGDYISFYIERRGSLVNNKYIFPIASQTSLNNTPQTDAAIEVIKTIQSIAGFKWHGVLIKFPWTSKRIIVRIPMIWKIQDLYNTIKQFFHPISTVIKNQSNRIILFNAPITDFDIILFYEIGLIGGTKDPLIENDPWTLRSSASHSKATLEPQKPKNLRTICDELSVLLEEHGIAIRYSFNQARLITSKPQSRPW